VAESSTKFRKGNTPWNKEKSRYRNLKNSQKRIDKSNPLFLNSIKPGYYEPGVYAIVNLENGKVYVGSSATIGLRLLKHRYNFKHYKPEGNRLIDALRKSPEVFDFSIIENVKDKTLRLEREHFWIKFYQSHLPEFGYNNSPTPFTSKGYKLSPQAIKMRSERARQHG